METRYCVKDKKMVVTEKTEKEKERMRTVVPELLLDNFVLIF